MSILIKGLNIPKDDELILRITPDGKVAPYDKLFGYRNRYTAEIVITPHGRLIDADKLAQENKNVTIVTPTGEVYEDGRIDANSLLYAPTVIESEE